MSKFNVKDLYSSKTFLETLQTRNDDWKNLGIVLFNEGASWANNEARSAEEEAIRKSAEGNFSPNTKIIPIAYACWGTPWEEFSGNKFYFDDLPEELPNTGKWKYRLPAEYLKSEKKIKVKTETFPNVQSIKIEDRSKGGFVENDHYYIRSNGEIWIKGARPYLNLTITVNWKTDSGVSNTTKVGISPEEYLINARFVSRSDRKVRVPYRPCYEGFEEIYEIDDYIVTFYRKICTPTQNSMAFDDPVDIFDGPYTGPGTGKFKEGIFVYYTQKSEPETWYTYTDPVTGVTIKTKNDKEIYGEGYERWYIQGVEKTVVFNDTKKILHLGGLSPLNQDDWKKLYDAGLWEDQKYFVMTPEKFFLSSSIERRVTQVKEYTNQTRFSDLLDCECINLTIITPPTINKFLTPNCDCTVTVSEEIYIICPDQYTDKAYNEYLLGRQSPPTAEDLINKDDPSLLEPYYKRILTADPCDFGDDSSRVWQPFAVRDVNTVVKNETDGLFDGSGSIDCYVTSSVQNSSSKNYYYDITDCNMCEVSKSYFSVAFGHYAGSGSLFEQFEDDDSPSKAIFSQYKLKALDDFNSNFTYYNSGLLNTSSMVYVISFYRDYMKDRLDPGNFEINLAELNGLSYSNSVYTGSNVAVSSSNKVLSLVDNSGDMTELYSCSDKNNFESYDIVSGSLMKGIHTSGTGTLSTNANYKTYGKVYPNLGIVVLDATLLNTELNFNTVTGSNLNGDNSYKLFTSLSGSVALSKPSVFRNSRERVIRNYSVRIAPVECNFSNNPSYLRSDGRIKHACYVDNPVTYITSVGLYSPSRELLAVAKLSKPIKKTKDDTVDIKIRLGL